MSGIFIRFYAETSDTPLHFRVEVHFDSIVSFRKHLLVVDAGKTRDIFAIVLPRTPWKKLYPRILAATFPSSQLCTALFSNDVGKDDEVTFTTVWF